MTDSTEEEREIEFLAEENERLIQERDIARAELDMLKKSLKAIMETCREQRERADGLLRAGQEIKSALMGLLILRDPHGTGFVLRLPRQEGGYPGLLPNLDYTMADFRECHYLFSTYDDADAALFSIVLDRIGEVERSIGVSPNGD